VVKSRRYEFSFEGRSRYGGHYGGVDDCARLQKSYNSDVVSVSRSRKERKMLRMIADTYEDKKKSQQKIWKNEWKEKKKKKRLETTTSGGVKSLKRQ